MFSSTRILLCLAGDANVAVGDRAFNLWPTAMLRCAESLTPARIPGDCFEHDDVLTIVQHFSVIYSSSCWGTIVLLKRKKEAYLIIGWRNDLGST